MPERLASYARSSRRELWQAPGADGEFDPQVGQSLVALLEGRAKTLPVRGAAFANEGET